jgi:hypothetical protein
MCGLLSGLIFHKTAVCEASELSRIALWRSSAHRAAKILDLIMADGSDPKVFRQSVNVETLVEISTFT